MAAGYLQGPVAGNQGADLRLSLIHIFFVYSTFLQRGYDQVLHDVFIQNLPVVLMLDRAGISNEDGQSHQGLYDFAYLRHIPHMTVLAPADADELEAMIPAALRLGAPCAIRYPKNAEQMCIRDRRRPDFEALLPKVTVQEV